MLAEYRWAEGQYDRLPGLAVELASRKVSVIVTLGGALPVRAAKAATSSIPIVFHIGNDPVRLGLVPSLNRPGGNVTGVSFLSVAVAAKRLALLHELVPTVRLIGLLTNPNNPNAETVAKELQEAARSLGLRLYIAHASGERDIDQAFATFVQRQVGAIFIDADTNLLVRRGQITTLATRHAIPAIYAHRDFAEGGALMSYGASITDAYREVGLYAGRILKGEKPADLPVMQSKKFEFVINLTTAKALGLHVPAKLLALADEVIE
jgi:putative ABC transport system substrate-binding protein